MNSTHAATIEAIKAEILAQLNCDPSHPPMHVDAKLAAFALGVQANTLAVWRSCGRYGLPFIKAGRSVKYRISDLAQFIANRTACNTGEAK
ncbi:helix-turn-helix domain-containing protein [Pseudomonas sp. GWSMS-1]|uniref:helix-turn-helix domain-containing protein n=1 Tax=Pseudomonas sp. GWSMS-1 TaxID=3308997 RepID=UPI003CED3B3D